jgi:uncharacterized protein YbbC (DUF1343 family)
MFREMVMKHLNLLLLVAAFSLTVVTTPAAQPVKTGAQLLAESNFHPLAGKRIGLIANQTTVVDGTPLAAQLSSHNGIRLAAIFTPEHGLTGSREDGVTIDDHRDSRSGTMVYSLYGKTKKPTPAMLAGIDLLLFDIQDIGTRFYTYISTMGLAMQAAAAAQIPFLVLDRPNPLGGEYLAGPLLEPAYASFTGSYPLPLVHGMTVGELALMIKGEKLLPGLENLNLQVITMEGWQRSHRWTDTGLPWIGTSPNIPDITAALLYPGVGLLEGTTANEGRGTREPFGIAGFPDIPAGSLAEELNGEALPGIRFIPTRFTPRSIPGMSSNPKFRDRELPGIRLAVTDPGVVRPVESAIHLLCALYDSLEQGDQQRFFHKSGFDRLAGTASLRRAIEDHVPADEIIASWEGDLKAFAVTRRPYLLY